MSELVISLAIMKPAVSLQAVPTIEVTISRDTITPQDHDGTRDDLTRKMSVLIAAELEKAIEAMLHLLSDTRGDIVEQELGIPDGSISDPLINTSPSDMKFADGRKTDPSINLELLSPLEELNKDNPDEDN